MRNPWTRPVYPTPHAQIVCTDCGMKGCLIPVPHRLVKDAPGTDPEYGF